MEGHHRLAQAYERLGRRGEASGSRLEGLRLARRYSESANHLGEAAVGEGEPEAAARLFREALRFDAGNAAARANLERIAGAP